jgi:SAM-dependent methyltransferase
MPELIKRYLRPIVARVRTRRNLRNNAQKEKRRLEIGPGLRRVPGFETLNIVSGPDVDYVADAGKRLPFPDNTFHLIYASHILEHIPWTDTANVLREWKRVMTFGGVLEIWVPDGVKICNAFVRAEQGLPGQIQDDNWNYNNPDQDPCLWASGRLYTYGDGTGNINHPNWHRAVFSNRYLQRLLREVGFEDVHSLPKGASRGYDHGWINLGVSGTKR